MRGEKKRITIFCFYDPEGIVDNSTEYLLAELRTVSSYLMVVTNGIVEDEGRKRIEACADEHYVRENIGYDGGAYADVLLNRIGENFLNQYDELLLCNNTFFGPFAPMQEIIDRVQDDVDTVTSPAAVKQIEQSLDRAGVRDRNIIYLYSNPND